MNGGLFSLSPDVEKDEDVEMEEEEEERRTNLGKEERRQRDDIYFLATCASETIDGAPRNLTFERGSLFCCVYRYGYLIPANAVFLQLNVWPTGADPQYHDSEFLPQ